MALYLSGSPVRRSSLVARVAAYVRQRRSSTLPPDGRRNFSEGMAALGRATNGRGVR